jgi:hypothetical protein
MWESEEAMQASRAQADQPRQQAAASVRATVESVEEYEVAVWEV